MNWRGELTRNYRVSVPHAGMVLSLALKRPREKGEYVLEIRIPY